MQWYASLLIQTGDQTRALRLLRASRRTAPRDATLRELRLQLEAVAGDLPRAIQERSWLYEQDPGNTANAMRLVALLSKTKPTFEHILDDEGQPEFDAGTWAMLSEQERTAILAEVAAVWRDQTERIIAALEAEGGDALEVAILRAQALKARGEVSEGEQVLRDFCARHQDDLSVAPMLALSRYQAMVERFDAAVATLEEARPLQTNAREVDHALADLMFNQQRWVRAAEIYRDLADALNERAVLLRLAECHLKLQQYEEAAPVLERAIANGGQDFFTAMLAAGIADGHGDQLVAQGDPIAANQKYAEAEAALDEAERLSPRNPLPHVRRAQRLVNEYGRTRKLALLDDAMLHLDRAEEAAAGSETISRVRVEIYRIRGDERGAIGELTRLLKRKPDSVPARTLLVQLYAQSGNGERAMATIDEAIQMNPTIALWHEAKGDLLVIMNRIPEAIPPAAGWRSLPRRPSPSSRATTPAWSRRFQPGSSLPKGAPCSAPCMPVLWPARGATTTRSRRCGWPTRSTGSTWRWARWAGPARSAGCGHCRTSWPSRSPWSTSGSSRSSLAGSRIRSRCCGSPVTGPRPNPRA
jgi:tetratricopeptide (TPR) repeat protein